MSKQVFDARPHDTVTYWLGGGRLGRRHSGRVVMVVTDKASGLFSHLVVNGGGKHGTPHLVDAENFLHFGKTPPQPKKRTNQQWRKTQPADPS